MNITSTILIVDDDLANLKTLEGLLRLPSYQIVSATSGLAALQKARAIVPDLILLDVMMPEIDGYEVCRRLRADDMLADVPIIMVTALNDRESRLRGIEAGADDFVTKPIDRMELRTRVRTITRLNRYRRLLTERTQRQQAEDETRRRNRELTLLNQVIATSALTLDVDEALHTACQALAYAFELPQATALIIDADRAWCHVAAEFPNLTRHSAELDLRRPQPLLSWLGALGQRIPVAQMPTLAHALAHKLPLVIDNAPDDVRLAPLGRHLREHGVRLLVSVPILVRDTVAGTIELSAAEARAFSNQDIALAQSIATAAGQALEMADLHQRLRRQTANLEATVAQRTLELQIERDRTRSILEALGEAVVVASPSGAIEYVNPATTALTGYAAEDVLGKSWRLWQSDRHSQQVYRAIQSAVGAGQVWRGEIANRRKDGTIYPVALTAAPLFDPQGHGGVVGMVLVQRDITTLKEAERLKDQFVSNVSHELRTPLSVITLVSGNLDTLYDRLDDAKRRAMTRDIRQQTRVLNDLITGVLEISRIDSGSLPTEHQRVDLARLAYEELEKQLALAQKKDLQLAVTGAEQLIVQGNDGQLRQVIRNLINNAIKYTRAGGQITCRCERIQAPAPDLPPERWPAAANLPAGGWAALCIADTGSGIGEDDLPRIFERFFRVKSQGNIPGTGLGLSIARELVELHQGQLAVTSVLGAGSSFVVYLPIVEEVPHADNSRR
jgi:PAS domain S-box-containing protein